MLACVSFLIIVGAGFYEHSSIVPVWSSAPPQSLMIFQGQYGINPSSFWKVIHPITIVLLIAALVLNWRTRSRKNIMITLGCYIVILIVTFAYYVPELLYITTYQYQNTVISALQDRAELWQTLSRIRLICMLGLSLVLLSGLSKRTEVIT